MEKEPGCNCQGGIDTCPLDGRCKIQSLVYKAEVTSTDDGVEKEYLGQTNVTFKLRYNNHKNDCKLPHKEKATCLSKYIWQLKRRETDYTINWSVAFIASPYSRETRRCQLCIMERTLIAVQDRGRGLNRRGEILTRCRHKDIHLLANWVGGSCPSIQGGQVAGLEGGGPPILDVQGGGGMDGPPILDVQGGGGMAGQVAGLAGEGSENPSMVEGEEVVEGHPDQGGQAGGVEGGGLPAQYEAFIAGPLTRSRAKKRNISNMLLL